MDAVDTRILYRVLGGEWRKREGSYRTTGARVRRGNFGKRFCHRRHETHLIWGQGSMRASSRRDTFDARLPMRRDLSRARRAKGRQRDGRTMAWCLPRVP